MQEVMSDTEPIIQGTLQVSHLQQRECKVRTEKRIIYFMRSGITLDVMGNSFTSFSL